MIGLAVGVVLGAVASTVCLRLMPRWRRRAVPSPAPSAAMHAAAWTVLVAAAVSALSSLLAPALARWVEAPVWPDADCRSDDELLDHARRFGNTGYHPAGTCRMGMDAQAVLDPQLRVNGIARLRVIDASVMPRLVSGNTNAAAIMIGEKGADLLLR